ncbi:MAG: DNA-directed RNA polymerase subunit omega, partial [Acetobacter sp.]|nr:DNA-directed RNA polymerase subunit omega [Acetobacter sp.]
LPELRNDLIRSQAREPEPEPVDEEVQDLVPTEQNIFGLQEVSPEEEAADDAGAVEAALSGRGRR